METNNIQQQILKLLKWDEQKLMQMVYDNAIHYLNEFISDYPQVIAEISRSKTFWNWWTNHWDDRDKEFLEQCEGYSDDVNNRIELYLNLHDPATLSAALYLNGQVLEETFVNVINGIVHEQKQREVSHVAA
jgi:hypothetical protein